MSTSNNNNGEFKIHFNLNNPNLDKVLYERVDARQRPV